MTPDDIYLRAVAAERALPQPALVTYAVRYEAHGAEIGCTDGRLAVTFGSRSSAGTYRVRYRSADGSATSEDPDTGVACSGRPLLEPTGGDIGALVGRAGAAATPAPAASGLPTIASVAVSGVSHYAVLGASPETLDGNAVEHLRIRALTDPERYPLTDLYVDAQSFLIRRISGTFADRYGGAPATIVATGDFSLEGAFWLQTHERVEFTAQTQPNTTRATLDARGSDFAFPSAP